VSANGGNIGSWPQVHRLVLADVPIYLVAAALLAVCLAIFAANDIGVGVLSIVANARVYALAGFAMVVLDVVRLLWRNRPAAPAAFLLQTWRRRIAEPAVLARLPLLAIAIVFMPFFSKMKSMIPLFNPFEWDPAFIAWDRALLLGHDAWEVLQPVFGYPLVTAALAALYHAWLLLIYMGTLFFVFHPSATAVVRQYFLGFILIWTVIGGGLATALASVGPCFMGPIFGDSTFDAQMSYLRAANEQVPVLTLHVQDLLLQWHQDGHRDLGSGITAMPSMHVAMAFLFWLGIRRISRAAGWIFFAFFAAIWIGSVHLAYHYAVDGLVSVIATAVLWELSGAVLRAWDRTSDRWQTRTGGTAIA
jgi:hypothetical protein